jgi:nicotinamidase-related amidase
MYSSKSKSSVLPTGGGMTLIDPSDALILLLDHQSVLLQTVKDISVSDLRRNVALIAKLATLLNIPVITTTSEPAVTNGPLMPEIHEHAPHAVYVLRKGEVNAWDNDDFVGAVRSTGRMTLVMAGLWTSVCVMFSALDARAAGYDVYAVLDAFGDSSDMASCIALVRFVQGGRQTDNDKCIALRTPPDLVPAGSGRTLQALRTCRSQLRCRGRELCPRSAGHKRDELG